MHARSVSTCRHFASLAAEAPEIDAYVLRSAAAERRFDLVPLFEACLLRDGGGRAVDTPRADAAPPSAAIGRRPSAPASIRGHGRRCRRNGCCIACMRLGRRPCRHDLAERHSRLPGLGRHARRAAENATSSSRRRDRGRRAAHPPRAFRTNSSMTIGAFAPAPRTSTASFSPCQIRTEDRHGRQDSIDRREHAPAARRGDLRR